jgi:hypothetical protein
MTTQPFFASKLGTSALISVAAMLAFNWYALNQPAAQMADLDQSAVQTAALA